MTSVPCITDDLFNEPTTEPMTYYVSMLDTFMSGWGQATGKQNRLVISCNSMEEARTVFYNAKSRSEMRDVKIHDGKPSFNPRTTLVSWHGREQDDYGKWFETDAWNEQR